MNYLKEFWQTRPLRFLLITGLLLRLIAVVFSKGYGWHDDHFLVIEAAQSWVDGTDYNSWLPSSGAEKPSGHSFLYSGLNFIFLWILKSIGIVDPQFKMLAVRLFHAFFSMLIIYFGFRITYLLSDLSTARWTGLLLVGFWFMPFLSVRNLVEFVTIPFLLWGLWILFKAIHEGEGWFRFLLAGFAMTLGVSIRFQTAIIVAGVVLALLINRKLKASFLFTIGAIISFSILQIPVDVYIWGKPFAEFIEYVNYNVANSHAYISNTWYSYSLLLLGILIPPLSFFLIYGFLISFRKSWLLFLPSFLFLLFHSYFPNKQERFILTIVPLIIIAGAIGLHEIVYRKKWVLKKWFRVSLVFVVVLNSILIIPVSAMYSKRARVEVMVYLSKYGKSRNIIVEDRRHESAKMFPEFYLKSWIHFPEVTSVFTVDSLKWQLEQTYRLDSIPDYVLFIEDYDLSDRVREMKSIFPDLTFETSVQPGFVDKILYKMNPKNANEEIFIYRTNYRNRER